MNRLLIASIVLTTAGPLQLFGAVAPANAADPDRVLAESDRLDDAKLALRIESALEGLESLDGLGEELDGLSDEIGRMIEDALRDGAVVVDRDWPDEVRFRGDRREFAFDTREFAREMERMARRIERQVIRDEERQPRGERSARAWRMEADGRGRADIEAEMRDLERELQRLQRELEEIEPDGDI